MGSLAGEAMQGELQGQQMSPAKRCLSGQARTLFLRHSKAAMWTVDDVARFIG